MALIDYTSYDEIRAALGVSTDEIEDDTLALPLYSDFLTMELDEIDETLVDLFASVNLIEETTRSKEQKRFFDATRLFSTYASAAQLTSSLPLFSPKDISDGKASTSRFSDSPYREVIKEIKSQRERLRAKLEEAFAKANSTTKNKVARVFFGVSSPSSDPVVE